MGFQLSGASLTVELRFWKCAHAPVVGMGACQLSAWVHAGCCPAGVLAQYDETEAKIKQALEVGRGWMVI